MPRLVEGVSQQQDGLKIRARAANIYYAAWTPQWACRLRANLPSCRSRQCGHATSKANKNYCGRVSTKLLAQHHCHHAQEAGCLLNWFTGAFENIRCCWEGLAHNGLLAPKRAAGGRQGTDAEEAARNRAALAGRPDLAEQALAALREQQER